MADVVWVHPRGLTLLFPVTRTMTTRQRSLQLVGQLLKRTHAHSPLPAYPWPGAVRNLHAQLAAGVPARRRGLAAAQAFSLVRGYSADTNSTATKQKACTKCGTPLPLTVLSCDSCGALQALPTSLDAYDLLGIDVASIGANGWQVDPGQLKTLWRKRVALSHPDRMGGKDEKEQQIAAQQSALINKAYETLREPLQRAHLLLEKHASSAPSEAESLEDPSVLMEVMELREGLEDAASEEEAAEVRERNKVNLDQTLETLGQAFATSPVDVDKARIAAVGLRYWTNIEKAAREWQPGKRVELEH